MIEKKSWIVDVGAFHGGEGERIHDELLTEADYPILYIEADPENFSHIKIRPIDKKMNLAACAFDGTVDFYCYKPETSSILPLDYDCLSTYVDGHTGKLANADDWRLRRKINIPARRLDSLFRELGIEHIRFLKIDTQGYDLDVIKSLGDRIGCVDELVCEVQLPQAQVYNGGASKDVVLDYMHEKGFLFVRQKYQSYGQELNMYFKRRDLLGGLKKEPWVSILTPCFNSAKYLEECIQSVLIQEYPFVEQIIQDAESKDGTLEILKKYDKQVLWKSEKDQGQSDGLNRALQRCRGDIIGVLNADDEYLPNAIEWAVKQFSENPEIGVIYGQQQNVNAQGDVVNVSEGPQPYDFKKMFCCDQVIPAQAAFIRRSALEVVGFYADVSRKTCPDYEMWVRLGMKFQFKYVAGIIAKYRWHEGSEGSNESIVYKMVESKIEVIDRVCSAPSIPLSIRRLRKKAISGVYFWSAGHFMPPMVLGKKKLALRQCWKAFQLHPSFNALRWFFIRFLESHDGLERLRLLRRRVREFLRGCDRLILGGCFYRYIYLPLKSQFLERSTEKK